VSHVDPIRLGGLEISVVCEGFAPLDLADECPGQDVDWSVERARHPWAFLAEGAWPWHVHGFVVRTDTATVVVDTGLGTFPPYAPWAERAGGDPWGGLDLETVDHVVVTHLHADHAGGAVTSGGAARFPNARYHAHPADWAHFQGVDDAEAYVARGAMGRLADDGRLSLAGEDREIAPGVRLIHTPGHTPGHRSVVVGDAVLLTGDLLHLPIQASNPSWFSGHDEDPELGARSRTAVLGGAAAAGHLIGVPHFARPFGRLVDGGWREA
jgi:glyoxylase-like metal-dependent hydrolase (beta-lactamase superfamily II)